MLNKRDLVKRKSTKKNMIRSDPTYSSTFLGALVYVHKLRRYLSFLSTSADIQAGVRVYRWGVY